ncbi:Hsp33 family molecular chaperone HslO [Synechococcus sp. PCC 7336]|uniref:Hsp33 family molecular chaperone HslO n=1 Tax=Synechococcus sp. PCC 7336 TaxID=195250 RepID=UPI00034BEBF2|nr:Hsp33 family molecular chaperone HslO [Synechococcus sp. PCC 7336]
MADYLIRATAADGNARAVTAISTQLCEEARNRHSLSYVATAALGRAMTAGLLISSGMKRADARVNLQFLGGGPLGKVWVDAGADGSVRGYVQHPQIELPPNALGKLDVGGAVGRDGMLHVIRDLGFGYPYSGTVQLVSGEIGDDVTQYLVTSEQTPSAVLLGVFVDSAGVQAAGGMMLQLLPGAPEQLIADMEAKLSGLTGFTPLLRSGMGLTDILENLLGDWGLQIAADTQMIRFHCPCSEDRMLRALRLLGEVELKDMIEKDGGAEATCHFCNEIYRVGEPELQQVIEQLQDQA